MLIFAVLAWWKRNWNLGGRLFNTLLTLSAFSVLWTLNYGKEFSNIWLIRFGKQGRCLEFTEWWLEKK